MTAVRRRLAAIVAADVVGYSRLMGQDEEGTQRRVKALIQDLIRPSILAHRGRLVKTTGDGVLAQFGSVYEAFLSSLEILQGAAARAAGVAPDKQIALRVGLNVGDIILDEGDVFGEGVNIAARLEAAAPAGGVCVSARAWEDLRKLDIPFEDMGELALKNISQPVRAYRYIPPIPRSEPPDRAPPKPRRTARPAPPASPPAPIPDPALQPAAAPPSTPADHAVAASDFDWRRPAIAAGVAALVLLVAGVAYLNRPRPDSTAFVRREIARLPCSWLRISDHSAIDGVQIYKLAGSSQLAPEALSRTLKQAAQAQRVAISQVIATDVAPLNAAQCAWIDRLRDFRYAGVPRGRLDLTPRGRGVTRVSFTLDPQQLGPAGAVYGIDPAGAVTRIIDAPDLAKNRPPAVVRHDDGTVSVNVDVDSAGWNGLVLMEAQKPAPDGLVEAPGTGGRGVDRFADLARDGGWRFELNWFRVGR